MAEVVADEGGGVHERDARAGAAAGLEVAPERSQRGKWLPNKLGYYFPSNVFHFSKHGPGT